MSNPACNCPIARSLAVFGDRWSLIILRDLLFHNKKHFHEFSDSPEKISSSQPHIEAFDNYNDLENAFIENSIFVK